MTLDVPVSTVRVNREERKRTMQLLLPVLLVLLGASQGSAQKPRVEFSVPPPSEWVHIDGSKNPELIPEWSAWDSAFRIVVTAGNLPTAVLQMLTKEEAAAIKAAANQHGKATADCEARGLKLMQFLGRETARVINEKTQELNLDCRRQTLSLRDRSMERLRPDARVALTQWVEELKKGMRASVPKAELDFYLQPK
jgi:hypothetical protein